MVQKMIWKILLVDDDEDDYLLTRQMLSMAQGKEIQLQWASTMEAGCKALTTGGFDAALIDYDLGAHTGLELIRSVDPPNFPVPLILLTGRGGYDVDLEAMQAGATLYLTKAEATPLLLDRSIRYAIERKQAEMELKKTRQELEARAHQAEESQRLLNALLEFIPEGITIASAPDVITLRTSRYGDEVLIAGANNPQGYSMADWLAKVEHFMPDGVTPAGVDDLPLTRAVKYGEHVEGAEFLLRRPDGVQISVECNASPIRDESGAVTAGVVTWRDISDRKRFERALFEANLLLERQKQELETNNQQLQAIFDHANAGLVLFDAEPPYRVLAHNKVYQEFWPEPFYSQGMLGKTVPEYTPGAEEQGVLDIYREVARTGLPKTMLAFPFEGLRGGRTWWNWDLAPIFENGTLKAFIQFGIDVTHEVLMRQQLEAELAERKRAEEKLQQQSRLIEISYEPIFIFDLDDGIITWNQGCEQLYGYTQDEAVGRVSHDLLKTRHAVPLETFLDILVSQGFWTGELHHITKDGREVIVESRQQLVVTGGKRLVLETNRDITGGKLAEQALEEARQQMEWLALLPEENPNPVVRVSFDGLVLYRNPPAARMKGWKCEVGEALNPALTAVVTRAQAQAGEIVEDIALNDGFYSISVVPILDKGYANIYGRDVARRKVIENALTQSEIRWSTTLASIGDAVLATDGAGNVLYMNAVAEALTGWTLPEAMHQPVNVVFHIISEVTRLEIENPVSKVLEQGTVVGLANHTLLVRKDGSEIGIDDSGAPIKDTSGKVDGVVLVFRDISERRQKEAQIARLSRLYRTLSQVNEAIVRTHDVDTLLSEMCEIISGGGFPVVWIGEVVENDVVPVAKCGPAASYLNEIKVTVEGELGKGPTGTCIREDRSVINPDFDSNPATLPWRQAALRYAIHSSAAFPLHRGGKAVGALTLYASEPNLFDADMMALLEQLTGDISFALEALEQAQLNAESQQALRLSEERYHSLFDGINEGFALHEIVCDADGKPYDYRFLDVNSAFERLTGLTRAQVIGHLHNEVLAGDDPKWVEIYGKVALTGDTVHFENYSPALKAHYEVFAYRPAPGQFAVLFLNITERKQVEAKLRESENRYRSLFESMHEGFFLARILYDVNGKPDDFEYLEVNLALEKMIGLERQQIVGHTAKELAPGINPEWLDFYGKVEQTGEPGYHSSYSVVAPMYVEAFAFRPAPGQFAVIATDISERKKAEDALREADRQMKDYARKLEHSNRELQDFASIASHDLQEPLRKVKSFGSLLQLSAGGRLNDLEGDYLDRMMQASERMQNLIDALLALSRVSTKVQSARLLDLGQLTAEVVSSMDMEIERLGARVEVGPLPEIEADTVQMRQLLQNLLGNALKFHRPDVPPIVQVSGQIQPPEGGSQPTVRIEVKDNGIGFDPQYLERIFQPFERLHGRSEYEGTGMGLPICKKIVERHQGQITATSVPGEGSTFIVILPLKQNA